MYHSGPARAGPGAGAVGGGADCLSGFFFCNFPHWQMFFRLPRVFFPSVVKARGTDPSRPEVESLENGDDGAGSVSMHDLRAYLPPEPLQPGAPALLWP